MSEKTFDVVDRPAKRLTHGPPPSPITLALVETANTGRAVRVLMNGETQAAIASRHGMSLKRRGFILRSQKDGDVLYL